MFNIIWEFIINLLESFLFAVICNAKFTKRQYHYHTAEQTLFILCKSLLITLMNISKISTIISGSITNFVGFPIPLVALSAHIE